MAPSFVFEPPSDEEYSEEQDYSDAEDEDEEEQEEASLKPSRPPRTSQSPWDFAAYSETVAEEHARRSTTSVDEKITKARQQLAVALPDPDDASSSGSESDKQVTI